MRRCSNTHSSATAATTHANTRGTEPVVMRMATNAAATTATAVKPMLSWLCDISVFEWSTK